MTTTTTNKLQNQQQQHIKRKRNNNDEPPTVIVIADDDDDEKLEETSVAKPIDSVEDTAMMQTEEVPLTDIEAVRDRLLQTDDFVTVLEEMKIHEKIPYFDYSCLLIDPTMLRKKYLDDKTTTTNNANVLVTKRREYQMQIHLRFRLAIAAGKQPVISPRIHFSVANTLPIEPLVDPIPSAQLAPIISLLESISFQLDCIDPLATTTSNILSNGTVTTFIAFLTERLVGE